MSEYSQGICQDGAVILKDGKPLVLEEIVQLLRELDFLEYFHDMAGDAFGPADDDVHYMIRKGYTEEEGLPVPEGY